MLMSSGIKMNMNKKKYKNPRKSESNSMNSWFVYFSKKHIPLLCPLNRPSRSGSPTEMDTPNPGFVVSTRYHLCTREQGLLGGKVWGPSGEGNVQDEPGTFFCSRKGRS